jgi:hypothetical protein
MLLHVHQRLPGDAVDDRLQIRREARGRRAVVDDIRRGRPEDLSRRVADGSGHATLVQDRWPKLRHQPTERLHLAREVIAHLRGEVGDVALAAGDPVDEKIE